MAAEVSGHNLQSWELRGPEKEILPPPCTNPPFSAELLHMCSMTEMIGGDHWHAILAARTISGSVVM